MMAIVLRSAWQIAGPGIAEADRGRVVERFVRLEQSRSEPGSGLGLKPRLGRRAATRR